MPHPARSVTLALVACAALAISCSGTPSASLDPFLPIDEAAPAFIAANCAVPVNVARTFFRQGSSGQTLVKHTCKDGRDVKTPRISMAVQFSEETRQVVYVYLSVSADTTAELDAQFNRVYAALVGPYVTPLWREEVRQFSRSAQGDAAAWTDLNRPGDSFQIRGFGEPLPSRTLAIRTRVGSAR